jgi:crossover junction endodeoxyribonuclease RuvC
VTGYGVIESDGINSMHIASGCLRLAAGELPARLGEIFNRVTELIATYQPNEMAVEDVFLSKNAASALKLGQARGAAICAGVVAGLEVAEYTPRLIKQAVVGNGGADKDQVQHMVKLLLRLDGKLASDQADALAVALSHAHSGSTLEKLAKAGWRGR